MTCSGNSGIVAGTASGVMLNMHNPNYGGWREKQLIKTGNQSLSLTSPVCFFITSAAQTTSRGTSVTPARLRAYSIPVQEVIAFLWLFFSSSSFFPSLLCVPRCAVWIMLYRVIHHFCRQRERERGRECVYK